MPEWDGITMQQSARQMDQAVDAMDELCKNLMRGVNSYSQVMQDQVQAKSREMITRIDALLRQIREQINRQSQKIAESGAEQVAIEQSAGQIDNF